jgi:hypothetical protein
MAAAWESEISSCEREELLPRLLCHSIPMRIEGEKRTKAEFLDVIGRIVFRVFLLAIHCHLY